MVRDGVLTYYISVPQLEELLTRGKFEDNEMNCYYLDENKEVNRLVMALSTAAIYKLYEMTGINLFNNIKK